jgi:hypothetical protein
MVFHGANSHINTIWQTARRSWVKVNFWHQ